MKNKFPLGMALLPRGSENAVSVKLNPVVIILKINNETANQNSEKAFKFNHFQLYHVVSVVFSNYYY